MVATAVNLVVVRVLQSDYTNGGAQVNPAMTVGTYFYGWNDATTVVSCPALYQ